MHRQQEEDELFTCLFDVLDGIQRLPVEVSAYFLVKNKKELAKQLADEIYNEIHKVES